MFDAMWTSVAKGLDDDPLWVKIREMPPDELRRLVGEAVRDARVVLDANASLFDATVSPEMWHLPICATPRVKL
jgi:hypothetical protein